MTDIEELKNNVESYKALLLESEMPMEDYSWGMANALELVLSMIDKRPAFYVQADKTHYPEDIEGYPEYFL